MVGTVCRKGVFQRSVPRRVCSSNVHASLSDVVEGIKVVAFEAMKALQKGFVARPGSM